MHTTVNVVDTGVGSNIVNKLYFYPVWYSFIKPVADTGKMAATNMQLIIEGVIEFFCTVRGPTHTKGFWSCNRIGSNSIVGNHINRH